ncbi:hypothetical protein TNCV_4011461 [Trichonephila clavipes]|nr:hypothetical protein TNCV_4011461 [Trichonephila clavipes]
MSSFLVLCEGDTRNRWCDGQVCPDVRQGTMAPWGRKKRRKRREEKTGETEKEKGWVRDWSEKTMNSGGVENGNMN